MISFQKKVADYSLWIDKARLAWIKAAGDKKFVKSHYPSLSNNPSLEEIYEAIKHISFAQRYTGAMGVLLETLDKLEVTHKEYLDEHWPTRPTRADEKLISDSLNFNEKVEKYGLVEAQRRHLRLGMPLKTRQLAYHFIHGPKPELDNPVDDTIDVLLEHGVTLAHLITVPHDVPIEARLGEYIIQFEQALFFTIATELVLRDTNIFLLDSDTMYNVMTASNDLISLEDMLQLPFDRVYIEFDKPITLFTGTPNLVPTSEDEFILSPGSGSYTHERPVVIREPFEIVGMGLYAHKTKQFCTAIFYSNKPGGNYREIAVDSKGAVDYTDKTTKVPVHAPPFLDIIAIHITNSDIRLQLSNETSPVSGYVGYMGPRNVSFGDISQTYAPLLSIARNVWRFLTCRNISYDTKRRPYLKPNQAIHGYTHKQGQQANLARDYRLIKVDRDVRPYGTGHKATELAFQVHMPAVFRRLVYCKECGDLHRHDLKGLPCRKCGKVVGCHQSDKPHPNMDIHEIYIPDYWRGPEDAPEQQHVRHMKPK